MKEIVSFYKSNIIADILQNLLPFSYIQLMPSTVGGLEKNFSLNSQSNSYA